MTIVRNISLPLSLDEVAELSSFRCQGLIRPKVSEVLDQIQQENIFEPALSYSLNPVGLLYGIWTKAPLAAHKFRGASQVAIGFLTLGPRIAAHIQVLFDQGAQLKALIAEGIANYALFKLQNIFLEMIVREAVRQNHQASGILSPGEQGFDISLQDILLSLAGGHEIDLKLTKTGMINPRHSLSALIGIGPKMKQWTQVDNCGNCAANDRCIYQERKA
ncbi:MAG: hypothetical protein COB36_10400 [Alphaproteobacteria bacterium]|nr:MAG: hypothetical protein COB36_10400 [Alphaproteobacteria bacterium]